jgi:hypothetical protein
VKWAVYSKKRGWLADTCAGGTWSFDVDDALWFDDQGASKDALEAAEIVIETEDIQIARVK